MPRLSFLHSDQFLPVQSELGMFSLLYLLSVVEAGWMFGFVFRVSSMCWFGSSFRVSRGQFVLLRGNSAAWRHRESSPLLCSAVVEFVAPWCYGFGTVLDLPRWLASRWASSGPARVGGRSCESGKRSFEEFPRVQRFERVKRERAHTGTSFLTVRFLDIAHRWLVQSERRYGTEPRLHGCSCKTLSCDEK